LDLKIVVLGVPRKKQIVSNGLIIVFMATALLLIFYDTYFFYVILLIEIGLSPFIAYDFRKLYMESKRLYPFLNILKYDPSENKIIFSRKLKVTKGRFRIIGIRTPVLIYDSDSVYEPETNSPIEIEAMDLNELVPSYIIAASRWGTGFGSFEAYSVVNKEYEGVVFFVVKKVPFKILSEPNEIRFQFKGCAVETIVKPLEYGFEVSTYMYGCGKKFKALAELICSDEFYGRKVKAKTKIVSAHKRFVERGFMRSEMKHSLFLIVTFPRRASLIDLLRILNLKTPVLVCSNVRNVPCKIVVKAYSRDFRIKGSSEAKLYAM